MENMTADAAVLAAWSLLMLAAGLARFRYQRLRSGGSTLARALEELNVRRSVVTVLGVRLPGLPELFDSDSLDACRFLHLLHPLLEKLAANAGAELEPPNEEGFRVYLGRNRPNPDHRSAGLDLALSLKQALDPLLTGQDMEPLAISVVTAEATTAPFPTEFGQGLRSFGPGPDRALTLRAEAAPGEILVDGVSKVPDAAFRFEERAGRRLLRGRVGDAAPEESPDEVVASGECGAGDGDGGPESGAEPRRGDPE